LAADKKLIAETVSVQLKNIEELWAMKSPDGKRLVVTI